MLFRSLFRQHHPERLIVHLLNAPAPQGFPPMTRQTWEGHFTSFGRMREDLAPVHDIRVRLRGRFARVYAAPGRTPLPQRVRHGWTEVSVPRLDTHIMVVAEGADAREAIAPSSNRGLAAAKGAS